MRDSSDCSSIGSASARYAYCVAGVSLPNGNGQANGQRSMRKATASQVRAIHAIAERLDLDLVRWLHEKFGQRAVAELSISEASTAIDELKALPAPNNGARR